MLYARTRFLGKRHPERIERITGATSMKDGITGFLRVFARSSGHRASEDESVGAVRTAPPAATNPSASVTLPRRHGIAAAFGVATVIFAAVALPVAFVAATVAPTSTAAPELLRVTAPPSGSAVPQQSCTSGCDCQV